MRGFDGSAAGGKEDGGGKQQESVGHQFASGRST